MHAPIRDPYLGAACRALCAALRADLCLSFVRIQLSSATDDLVYVDGIGDPDGLLPPGASVQMMIRDPRGIVGQIDLVDGCHPTTSGRAIQTMDRIVQLHAAALRTALSSAARPVRIAV